MIPVEISPAFRAILIVSCWAFSLIYMLGFVKTHTYQVLHRLWITPKMIVIALSIPVLTVLVFTEGLNFEPWLYKLWYIPFVVYAILDFIEDAFRCKKL